MHMNILVLAQIYPYGTTIPATRLVYEGDDAMIICYSKTIVKFMRYGKDVYRHTQVGNILILQNVIQKYDDGFYTCYGTRSDNSTFKNTSELLIGGWQCCNKYL